MMQPGRSGGLGIGAGQPNVLDYGRATSLSGDTLIDTTKDWDENALAGHLVRLVGGNNDGALGVVGSNGARSLRFLKEFEEQTESPILTHYLVLADTVGTAQDASETARLTEAVDALTKVLVQIRDGLSVTLETDLSAIDV